MAGVLVACMVSVSMATISPIVVHAESCLNRTLRVGSSKQLPDCRVDEQVSPPEKNGYDAVPTLPAEWPANAAPTGEAITYGGNGPFPGAPSSLVPNAHFSTRTPNAWRTVEHTPPTPGAILEGLAKYFFSEDLSQMVVQIWGGKGLTNLPAGNEELQNLFLRKANGSYSLLTSLTPTEIAPEGSPCLLSENCSLAYDVPSFAGASSDFDHVIFEMNGSLGGTGAPGGFVTNLYETVGGQAHAVGVLPDETLAPEGSVAGAGNGGPVNHAISADGRRVVFASTADGGQPEPAQKGLTELYDRIEGTSTVEISATAAGAKPANPNPEPAQFWTASSDGSDVFFTSNAELTTTSNTGEANNSADLYRYDANTGGLTDLTVDTNPADALSGAGVEGVVGTSRDGSYVYFVAKGELVNGKGVGGEPNLYLWHEDPSTHDTQLSYVTTLNTGDLPDWTARPYERQSYVTPDGRHLAFMSVNQLTGYDNSDRNTHNTDTEVYEYSAEPHTLACASCDPSGEPPVGGAFLGTGAEPRKSGNKAFHQLRVLSDDGTRLFFSSLNPLVAEDRSLYSKVYEYEQSDTGSCANAEGCRYLLSNGLSGAPEAEDVFVDADSTGANVFFATFSVLAATDTDNLYDVYDSRVAGGFPPAPNEVGCTECTDSGVLTAPPASQLASQLVVGSTDSVTPPAPKGGSKPKTKPSCRARANRIINRAARRRALKRCPKPKHARANPRAGR
jgi:hypothetical protein